MNFFLLENTFKITLKAVYGEPKPTSRKEILCLNVLRFMRRSTIFESKLELLKKVMNKSYSDCKVYYVNHYSLSVVKMETLRQIFTIYDGCVSLLSILIFRLQ